MNRHIAIYGLLFAVLLPLSACTKPEESHSTKPLVKQQAVAMPDAFSADVAMTILDQGGNAVDAAIAAQFAIAVTYPEAGNIGGGGFMITLIDGKTDYLDYREIAPTGASRDMYLDENGELIEDLPVHGILASGVPGTVAGMWEAHQKYGSLPWQILLQPAVDLARNGFVMPAHLADRIASKLESIEKDNITVNFADYFAQAKAGEVFVQQELAETLKRIQLFGTDGFYKGETASLIASFMENHNGLITEDDLLTYEAKWRAPLETQWRNYTVVSAAPPSSGGIAVNQWLRMFDIVIGDNELPQHNSENYIHLLSEIGKRVFADRAAYLGDPDFFDVPVTQLLMDDYLASRASEVNRLAISSTPNVKPGLDESHDTTHFSIVDKDGNAVSNTTTINLSFGSGMVVQGAGFLLNNEMDDFSAKPGVPNSFGAIGGEANAIAPKKRMLSSMSPTLVLENGDIRVVTGSPGGTTIISSVYQSILNALVYGMTAQNSVDTPRFHHQLLPKDMIFHHEGIDGSVIQALTAMGYTMREADFGDLQVIINNGGVLDAASETKNRGEAMVKSLH